MPKRIVVCAHCGESKPHQARGLCAQCYQREWRKNPKRKAQQAVYAKQVRLGMAGHIVACAACGEMKPHSAHGLCHRCYQRVYTSSIEWKERHAADEQRRRQVYRDEYRQREHARSETERRKTWRRIYGHAYYESHKDDLKEYAKGYRRADKERQRVYMERKRSRKRNAICTLTPDEWQGILEAHGYACRYCGATNQPLEQDHQIPLARNGTTTKDNIVPACPNCNRSKKTMTPEEFAEFLKTIGKKE